VCFFISILLYIIVYYEVNFLWLSVTIRGPSISCWQKQLPYLPLRKHPPFSIHLSTFYTHMYIYYSYMYHVYFTFQPKIPFTKTDLSTTTMTKPTTKTTSSNNDIETNANLSSMVCCFVISSTNMWMKQLPSIFLFSKYMNRYMYNVSSELLHVPVHVCESSMNSHHRGDRLQVVQWFYK